LIKSSFVSNNAKRIFWFLSKIFSKRKIAEIFSNRIKISEEFDKFLEKNSFDCIVEFGCGYSLRGFEYSLRNEKSLYIDTDFSEVVNNKKQILDKICEEENIIFPKSYLLIPFDVLKDNIPRKLNKLMKKRNLFFAEGLTTYFSQEEYSKFMSQIQPISSSKNNVFFSQENFLKKSLIKTKIFFLHYLKQKKI
jgi:O-methyltransferase involved in polyketide biosynthesis